MDLEYQHEKMIETNDSDRILPILPTAVVLEREEPKEAKSKISRATYYHMS